ncbi:MAG: iron transporter FeoB, partial [Aliifodinibius sp.]|nr:iron transporter FeoB [Fodinibius sp.]NIV11853.1 iron transporter FeoB [Fodinibius sp.]NIY25501.1 iron transporter FeoB [Fodinibius sp.]
VVVCLNLIDEAKRKRLIIDQRSLSKDLGIPVIPTAARTGVGMQELLKAINEVASGEYVCRPYRIKGESKMLKKAIDRLI